MKRQDRELLENIQAVVDGKQECSKELLAQILVAYQKKEARHDKIMSQSDKQQMGLVKETEQKERMLAQQAKMAAMGEMIDAIAHQWKQPLNAISMLSELAEMDFEEGEVDLAYMQNHKAQVFAQIEHLIATLDEFRNFFRPNKNSSEFEIKKAIESVLVLVKDEFIKHQIEIELSEEKSLHVEGIENEFKHIVLNILNNAKDAFVDNSIKEKKIAIKITGHEDKNIVSICDNAGGVPEHIIKDIFKPNVTTKAEGKGTGIGLYMSEQIAQKMGGRLRVKNSNKGACFTLEF